MSSTSTTTSSAVVQTIALFQGVVFTAMGLWAALDAASFGATIADYGPRNDHLVHDYAAASLTFGVALLAAALWRSWRTPVLAMAALWNGFHLISHIADHRDAASTVMGLTEIGLLALVSVLFATLSVVSHRDDGLPSH